MKMARILRAKLTTTEDHRSGSATAKFRYQTTAVHYHDGSNITMLPLPGLAATPDSVPHPARTS